MRIHHLNCTTMCPPGGRMFDARRGLHSPASLVCHCLAVETDEGVVLVDTGFGLNDVHAFEERLAGFFLRMCRPMLEEDFTAIRQLEHMGFEASDVRHIVLTHLDFDHAGGLDDFPRAKVHLLGREADAATAQKSWLDRRRFRPQQWSSMPRWKTYEPSGERWFGFDCVRELEGLPPEILLVPLIGHTRGHCGIAVRADDGWMLHAGDAYFFHGEMEATYRCTPGCRMYQNMMQVDGKLRHENQRRLRELKKARGGEVRLFCAHDYEEFERERRREQPSRLQAPPSYFEIPGELPPPM